MLKPFHLLCFTFLLFVGNASAQSDLKINGISTIEIPGSYKAWVALHVESLSDNRGQILSLANPVRLELRFIEEPRSARSYIRSNMEAIAVNASDDELGIISRDLFKFTKMLKVDFEKDDQLLYDISRDGVRVRWNGVELGTLNERLFGVILLRTWIGDIPVSSQVQEDLLVAGNVSEQTLAAFNGIKPSLQRISKIAGEARQPKPVKKPKPQPKVAQPTKQTFEFDPPLQIEDEHIKNAREAFHTGNFHPSIKPEIAIEGDFPRGASEYQKAYIRKLRKQIVPYLHYPRHLLNSNTGGEFLVKIRVNQLGKPGVIEVVDGPNEAPLIYASKRACRAAGPYSPFPEEFDQGIMEVLVRLNYKPS